MALTYHGEGPHFKLSPANSKRVRVEPGDQEEEEEEGGDIVGV